MISKTVDFSWRAREQDKINKKLEDTAVVFGFHIGTKDSVRNVDREVVRTRKCLLEPAKRLDILKTKA